jgi:hypothetical protein
MKISVRVLRPLAYAWLLAATVACGGGVAPGATSRPGETAGPGATANPGAAQGADDPALVATYGYAPVPDPAITYQPDVVLIGGGPRAIRAVSPEGLRFSMDAKAPGVDQLAIGKIMFAASQAVGRVHALEPNGDVVDVTLIPVALGEVIKDGHLQLDQALSLDTLATAEMPQLPDAIEDLPSDDLTGAPSPAARAGEDVIRMPTVALAVARQQAPRNGTPSAAEQSKSTTVKGWTLTGYKTSSTIGLRGDRGVAAGKPVSGDANLKVVLDAHLEIDNLRVVADIPVVDGQTGSGHFRIYGIKGLVMSARAGVVNGLSDNRKVKIEIPIELKWPTVIAGFPATFSQKFKFLVQTAFTAKNGNLAATAEWDLDGSIGVDGSTVTLPTMTARGTKLIDSLSGVSVGVNGAVVAVSFQFGYLIGLPYAGAGPTAALITSLGLTNGSSLGIVQCKQVSITSVVSGGVVISVFDPVKQALKKLTGYEVPEQTTLVSKNVLQESWVKPDVTACR